MAANRRYDLRVTGECPSGFVILCTARAPRLGEVLTGAAATSSSAVQHMVFDSFDLTLPSPHNIEEYCVILHILANNFLPAKTHRRPMSVASVQAAYCDGVTPTMV